MRTIIVIKLFVLITAFNLQGQHVSHENFYPNIVNIENGDFGFIIGDYQNSYYFITALRESAQNIPDELDVYVYQRPHSLKAKIVRSFALGSSRVALFSFITNTSIQYRKLYYKDNLKADGPYYTFFEDVKSSHNWYANSSPFEINNKSTAPEIQLKSNGAIFFSRGMPIIDSYNNVVGIISDKPDEFREAPIFWSVNMAAIADKLYDLTKCKYFHLIEWGQLLTRCAQDEQIKEQKREVVKQQKKAEKLHAIGIAPTISLEYVTDKILVKEGEKNSTGVSGSVGLKLWTNPDQRKFRLSIYPSVQVTGLPGPETGTYYKDGFKVTKYSWLQYEVPIQGEFVINRAPKSLTYWGMGYVPFYRPNMKIHYTTNANTQGLKMNSLMKPGLGHKVIGGIGLESGVIKATLFCSVQITSWYDEYADAFNTYYPYGTDVFDYMFRLGVNIGIRLNGKAGLKVSE